MLRSVENGRGQAQSEVLYINLPEFPFPPIQNGDSLACLIVIRDK